MNLVNGQLAEMLRGTIVKGGNLSSLFKLVQQLASHGAADGDMDSSLVSPDFFVESNELGEDAALAETVRDDG